MLSTYHVRSPGRSPLCVLQVLAAAPQLLPQLRFLWAGLWWRTCSGAWGPVPVRDIHPCEKSWDDVGGSAVCGGQFSVGRGWSAGGGMVSTTADIQPALPLGAVFVMDKGFGLSRPTFILHLSQLCVLLMLSYRWKLGFFFVLK